MKLNRRSLLAAGALASLPRAAWASGLSPGAFTHGIASGDPLPDGVILWTRFAHNASGRIGWQIAEDESFARVARQGETAASPGNDYCAKVDVRGLQPGRAYFYRFLSASGPSVVGRTRTAPAGATDALTIALFSCSNFPYGYFHAYGHAAQREDVDLAIHCGDYIYEMQRGDYPSAEEAVPGRVLEPANEIARLADYYQRYAAYHTDANLLELRRMKPLSVVWDDHELTNDAWRGGAQNHQPDTEGLWSDRVAAASKAYFDWMPIRRPASNGVRIYRSLDWGDLARIALLDTRLIGRDQQLDYRTQLLPRLAQGGAEAAAAVADFRADLLNNPHRTMMGPEQEAWLARSLAQSKRRGHTWQIIAQQVVMADTMGPAGISRLLPDGLSAGARLYFAAAEQLAALGLPWNMDAWSGYPAARARFLAACAANANNAVVLGGDSHNLWANNLAGAAQGRLAAIEFAGGSVTSPGFEHSLTNAAPGEREAMMRSANPQLAACDLTNRGYGALRFTRTACDAEWIAFGDVRSPQAPAPSIMRLRSAASAAAGPGAWAVES
jgi:alkaline phosphatase D